jgi:hypothetical protein
MLPLGTITAVVRMSIFIKKKEHRKECSESSKGKNWREGMNI